MAQDVAHHLTVKLDNSDPRAVFAFMAAEITPWPAARRAALLQDIEVLVSEDMWIDLKWADGQMTATTSADLLDLLRRHGVGGAKFGELP